MKCGTVLEFTIKKWYDKTTNDVINEISQKYKNVQKGVGDMMRGTLLETSARKIKTTAEIEKQKRIATRMLQDGELSIDKIAMYTELKVEEVEELAGIQTV